MKHLDKLLRKTVLNSLKKEGIFYHPEFISGSDWLGFTKPTCKELKQDQHDFLFMEGLLCYP